MQCEAREFCIFVIINLNLNKMETLKQIEKEVKKIGKGYSTNFNYGGKNMHFINGANTICFSLNEPKVKFHTVGGSRFFDNDMLVKKFINSLPAMLLTTDEIKNTYRKILKQIKS